MHIYATEAISFGVHQMFGQQDLMPDALECLVPPYPKLRICSYGTHLQLSGLITWYH